MAKHPGTPKKDPAKPTRAKASRPDLPPTEPALAKLLNPGIDQGTAGPGSQTGLRQPPDNSWDRRADFANAHTARKSTQQGKSAQQGLSERPQAGYVGKGAVDLDPELAKALGYDDGDPSKPLIGQPPPERDEISEISEPQREKRHRPSPQPVTLGVTASMHALEKLLREGREEFREQDGANKSGRRIGRRGRKNPKAAALSSSSPISSRRATSRRPSPSWSRACGATTAARCCSASPARARPSPWPR